ncbi:hypothetical protein OH768_37745 [Streptomyces sp. NBC_01622]|uniref:hypothetical protein n=1 Tax=Streptomyces sp. NBC_01622 TaxID=2975903 RepID=UPI003869983E|nr:hypothetical protein OH768_37745 [Streptomyces sp. NBC_01622]
MGSQTHGGVMGDAVHRPEGPDDREDEGILGPEDTLTDQGSDASEEGWSPSGRPLAVEHEGTTARERYEDEGPDQDATPP